MGRTTRFFTSVAAPAVLVLALASCGSDDSTDTTSAASGAGSTAATASSSAGVTEAKAAVAKLTERPTEMEVNALPKKPDAGKTLDFVACATPTCKAFVPYLRQATDAVGWKLKVIEGGFEPKDIANAWNQVLRDKPAGVIASGGVPTALFANQLKQLDAAKIPVVLHDQPASDKIAGVTAVVMSDEDNFGYGKNLADLMLADAGGKDIHLGIFQTPQVPVFVNERKALNAMIESDACESCSADKFEFPVSAQGSKLPSQVVSFVRSHPDVNYLYFDYNDAVDGVPAALSRAGLADKVKILSNSISTTEAGYMRAGQMFAASANPWPETLWKDFHIILASDQGASVDEASAVKLPNMIVTKDNLPDFSSAFFPLVENYQDIFKKAWGAS